MADSSDQRPETNQEEGESGGGTIGSPGATEEGLGYETVSGAVTLDEAGEDRPVIDPTRDEKPDLGREPEYYYTEHSGGNTGRTEASRAMEDE